MDRLELPCWEQALPAALPVSARAVFLAFAGWRVFFFARLAWLPYNLTRIRVLPGIQGQQGEANRQQDLASFLPIQQCAG